MKKYFTINNQFKKYLPIFLIMLSVIVLMGTSYALLRSSQVGENTYVMNVGLLEVSFLDSETNALTLTDMVPSTDEEGMNTDKELSFTVKNTGTIDAKYNVYLEETSKNPEFKSVIRHVSNKNNEGYKNPKTLSENNFIDTLGELSVGETATYKVKVWLKEDADSTYMDKTFTARVVVEGIQGDAPGSYFLQKSINESTCNPSITDTDGTIYLSGTNDCVNFNYVWYSGKLWRITSIAPDGTMKMITEDNITSIAYGEDYNFYTDETTTSWIYQWLNEDFLDTLYNYENIIKTDSMWNVTSGNGDISYKLPETTMVPAKVGLLNSYEYYKSYENLGDYDNGYLNIGYFWWLSNPYNSVSSSDVWYVGNGGDGYHHTLGSNADGSRPVINLRSIIQLAGGTGTKSDPYRIKGDKEDALPNTTLLKTRTSGEYVNFDGEIYRIVGIENDTIKINKVDYIRDESDAVIAKYFASTYKFGLDTNAQSEDYWDYYLNNIWYNNISSTYKSMLEKGTYYLGMVDSFGKSYKLAICATASNTVSTKDCTKTSTIYSGYVGLPRYGEMFSSQLGSGYLSSSGMWLITPYNSSYIWTDDYGNGSINVSTLSGNTLGNRPSINLKSTVVIKSGSGTEQDPFVVGLKEEEVETPF